MPIEPKAIFFDYGGTLDADGIPWKEHFQSIYESMGVRVPQERFDRAFYDSDDSLTAEGLDGVSLADTLDEQVRRVLAGLGRPDPALQKNIAGAFRQDTARKVEENKTVLRRLKSRYKLGIISNFYGNLPAICKELGLSPLFDVVADSRRVGHIKPSAELFNYALSAVGVQAGQALMVGDSLKRDMRGAKALGMPHVLLIDRHNPAPPPTCCPGDGVIRAIPELLELLPVK
ncbi:MAG: HAD family hydrolase [Nitrospinae bacterium]|nr:HAD family hydrolase [Nitrospinota bacterium]